MVFKPWPCHPVLRRGTRSCRATLAIVLFVVLRCFPWWNLCQESHFLPIGSLLDASSSFFSWVESLLGPCLLARFTFDYPISSFFWWDQVATPLPWIVFIHGCSWKLEINKPPVTVFVTQGFKLAMLYFCGIANLNPESGCATPMTQMTRRDKPMKVCLSLALIGL